MNTYAKYGPCHRCSAPAGRGCVDPLGKSGKSWKSLPRPHHGRPLLDEWECMICGQTRPDQAISVRKVKVSIADGFESYLNVKHCNDKDNCAWRAAKVRRLEDLPRRDRGSED